LDSTDPESLILESLNPWIRGFEDEGFEDEGFEDEGFEISDQ
jgi:hypothetical protein